MPAEVETAAFSNTPAWHNLGVVFDEGGTKKMTVQEALQLSDLDWRVSKVKIYGPQRQLVRGRFGVQRDSDKSVLGVVGKTWEPVQNADGFAIIEDVIEQAGGKCWIEAAGALDGGRRVWVLAHIDDEMQIAGEEYKSFLLFSNGHDGRSAVTAAALNMRVVCKNTLEYGIGEAEDSGRIVRVRHTVNADQRIQAAHAILGMRNRRAEELAQQGEWLVEQEMSDGDFNEFLELLLPVPEEQEGKPAETMIRGRQDQIRSLFFNSNTIKPIGGTAWGAVQSVIEYSDHHRKFTSEETQLKAQFGFTAAPLKQRAVGLAVAMSAN